MIFQVLALSFICRLFNCTQFENNSFNEYLSWDTSIFIDRLIPRLLYQIWNNVGEEDSKRRKMDIKLESEDANFSFPEVAPGTSPDNKSATVRTTVNGIGLGGISGNRSGNANSIGRVVGVTRPRPAMGVLTKRTSITHQGPVTLISQLCMSLDRCRISFNNHKYIVHYDRDKFNSEFLRQT